MTFGRDVGTALQEETKRRGWANGALQNSEATKHN